MARGIFSEPPQFQEQRAMSEEQKVRWCLDDNPKTVIGTLQNRNLPDLVIYLCKNCADHHPFDNKLFSKVIIEDKKDRFAKANPRI